MRAGHHGPDLDDVVLRLRAAGCVFAEEEADLLGEAAAGSAQRLEELVRQRVEGAPLELVLGWAQFRGLRIAVGPGVFVPRRRTELLVAEAVRIAPTGRRVVALDLCCGAGAIGAALAAELPDVEVHAADVDPRAVAWARRNLTGPVQEGDLFAPLSTGLRGRVDLLAANVPYVPSREVELLPREARLFEPRGTLDGGADGLALLRRVAGGARDWLAPGGAMLSEVSERQVDAALEVLGDAGLTPRVVVDEDLGATVVVGLALSSPGGS